MRPDSGLLHTLLRPFRAANTAIIARGAGIAFAAQVAGAGLTFLMHVLLARWAGPSGYGAYSFALAWISVLSIGTGLGFPEVAVRFLPEYETTRSWPLIRGFIRRSTGLVVLASLATGTIGVALIIGWYGFPAEDSRRALVIGLGVLPFFALMRLHTQMCRATNQIAAAYMLPRVIHPLLMIGGMLLISRVANTPLSGTYAMVLLGTSFALVGLVQREALWQSLPAEANGGAASYVTGHWLRVAVPFLLITGLFMTLQQTDLIVVGIMLDAEAAGLYKAAVTIATPVGFVLTAVTATAAPQFARLYAKGDRKQLQSLVRTMAHWLFWPALVIAGGIALTIPLLLSLFGSGFSAARVPAFILLFSHLINAGMGAVGYLLTMTDHHTHCARVYGLCALLNLSFTVGGVYFLGLTGAALATTLSMLVWNTWLHRIVSRRLNLSPSILSVLLSSSP